MEFDIHWVIFGLLIAENIIMVKLGSYPYKWGLPFARRSLPENLLIEDIGGFWGRLKIMKDKEGNIFIRNKHFPMSWGPYIFVGQVKKENPTELIIRIGPLSFLTLLYFVAEAIFQNFYNIFVGVIFASAFLYLFFRNFLIGYEKLLKGNKKAISEI